VAPEGLFGNSVVWKQAGDVEVSYGVRNSSCADACDRCASAGLENGQSGSLAAASLKTWKVEGTVHAVLVVPS
jgi:hypothetical protein